MGCDNEQKPLFCTRLCALLCRCTLCSGVSGEADGKKVKKKHKHTHTTLCHREVVVMVVVVVSINSSDFCWCAPVLGREMAMVDDGDGGDDSGESRDRASVYDGVITCCSRVFGDGLVPADDVEHDNQRHIYKRNQ